MKFPFNKYSYLYVGFLLLGLYGALFTNDYIKAAGHMGIALAFDPFDQNQKWGDRPKWQKAALIIHLALVAAIFVFGMAFYQK